MRLTLRFTLLFLTLLAGILPGFAQETHGTATADSVAGVPALDRYHEVISVLWHVAWPKKDTEKLAALLPGVKSGMDSVAAATLPVRLKEKKALWDRGVVDLRSAVKEYAEAVSVNDSTRLLKAAEVLHARYEALVRIIRPR
jgi:hypothetical protein